ncbi:cytochrome P450 [Karstenula rhodostoma CBS 690.94]|uniref:Cytochrome P450 n=1 Tax=Karstenula rhodostoma CBS 690.94 TaxID=1392251 RepID=A0A9P4P7Z9_9PLEO|nr:cytochrome P450 [Karstenula rhodostoma CBS 690.94]
MMAPVAPMVIAPFFLGVIMHLGFFMRGEWHLQAPHIILAHALAFTLLLVKKLVSGLSAWYGVALPFLVYLCGLLGSMAIYRLFFHRLRSFPGPRLAAVSKLWHVWLCRYSKNHLVLESWRQKYGTFVRTGPSEITIIHPAGLEWLDGPQNRNARSDWYDLLHPGVQVFSRDPAIQTARRKVWDKAMSLSAVKQYYRRITTHVLELESIISAQNTKPIVMNDLLYQMTFDVLKDIGFGQANEEVKDGASKLGGSLSILGPTTPSPWILRMAFALFPGVWNIPHWFKFLEMTQSIVVKRLNSKPESVDIASFFIEDSQRKDADMISREAVGGDCGVILLAGSTSGPSLILLFYCLARWPEHAEKIRQELRNVDYNDMTALSALPHLTATINESLRLYPAGPTFGSRITGPEGLNCEGVYIPGGIKVVAPRWSNGRLEEAYASPHEFIPERWYSKPEFVKDKRAFAPFSMGRNSCAGKKVAMSQMRLAVAILVSKYSIRFAPGTSDEMSVEKNMRDQLTPLPGELKLVFEKLE